MRFAAAILPAIVPARLPLVCVAALAGYVLVMFTSPVRASLRDGARAVRRYATLWLPLGLFGYSNALFQLVVREYFFFVLPPAERPAFVWMRAAWRDPQHWLTGTPESLWYLPAGALRDIAAHSVLPGLESVAGIFNCLVSTFPLAAVAAVLLLVNWDGHHGVLWRALRFRFERFAPLVYIPILVCAIAAAAKPLVYVVARSVDGGLWLRWSQIVAWLAFLFEYLFGVCVQIWLVLIAYCWVRGRPFEHRHLLDFAIRRLSFVVKWAALVLLVSSVFIDLPLILKNFAFFTRWFTNDDDKVDYRLILARSIITAFLFLFSTVQITLVLHNESLVAALRDHARFIVRNWWPFAWYLIAASFHFYILQFANLALTAGLGEGTGPGILWQLAFPWIAAVIAAWMLASWVCLYRQLDTGRGSSENWIQY